MDVKGTGTLFGDIFYFDGVGFAVEPEDGIVWRHCGGFTIHREREVKSARDGEAREGERERIRGRRASHVSN